MRKPFFLPFLLFSLLSVSPSDAGTIEPALEQALSGTAPHQEVRIIVKAKGARLDAIHDRDKSARRSKIVKALKTAASMHSEVQAFLKRKGINKTRSLWIINGMALSANADVIRGLAVLPQVESIALDEQINEPVMSFATPAAPQWNISAIGAPELWKLGYTGQGVVVANMDSGVDATHPDLASRWRGGTNSWFDPNGEHPVPADVSGHGTRTMGVIVGGDAGGTSIGVAPGARWIAVKIFNDAGIATYSGVHEGFQWLLDPDGDPDTDDAPDVVNNSWGLQDPEHRCYTEFDGDVGILKAAGIAVTFAAGNDGPDPSTSMRPANYAGSFSVGAVDSNDEIADFSSRGPSACGGIFPKVVAPGVNILTTDLNFGLPGAYATVSGTSIACPHVSGAIALLLNVFPDLEPSLIENALMQAAKDLGVPGEDNNYGYGLIDVVDAFRLLKADKPGVYLDGLWYLDQNGNGSWEGRTTDRNSWFGFSGAIPVAGDWNGGGAAEIGVYDPLSFAWYIDYSANGLWDGTPGDHLYYFGFSGTKPVIGDWSGSGYDRIGVYDPATSAWYLDYNGNGAWDGMPVDRIFSFGFPGVVPVSGDWSGNGTSKIGVYDPATSAWYLDYNGNGAWDGTPIDRIHNFGFGGTIPLTGDWSGSGATKIGVYDPVSSLWYMDRNGSGWWDGMPVDAVTSFGFAGAHPVPGNW